MKVDLYLKTEDGQELAVYTRGNPKGRPIVFLHGGPGGQISERSFDFFDLDKWYVLAFDQRGCGQSKPFATLENNTIFHSIKDIEMIRKYFDLKDMDIFGGSYGSTLALAYAISYPDYVNSLVLRGIFLGRQEDIHWLYQDGASYFYPDAFEPFKNFIEEDKRGDLVSAYYEIFKSQDENLKLEAARRWSHWEGSIVNLLPPTDLHKQETNKSDISLALLECHYFANKMHWTDDNYILNNLEIIKNIPTYIVHGRYDVDCRPIAAYELCQRMNSCKLYITEKAGHSPYEETSFKKLKEILNKI